MYMGVENKETCDSRVFYFYFTLNLEEDSITSSQIP